MKTLKELRSELDAIDRRLDDLFHERMQIIKDVAEVKKAGNLPVYDEEREKEVLGRIYDKEDELNSYYYRFRSDLMDLSKQYQNQLLNNDFFACEPYVDGVFSITARYNEDRKTKDNLINASIGTLKDNEGNTIAYKTVYDSFSSVPKTSKASYASGIQGNSDYLEEVYNWINRKNNITCPHQTIATVGGTGAIILPLISFLERHDELAVPETAWASYKTMSKSFGFRNETYNLTENGQISVEPLIKACREIMNRQKKLVVIINDPCQNPTGITLGCERWEKLVAFFNELSAQGPVIIVNDIAYMDYARDQDNVTEYLSHFNNLNDNCIAVIAFSCSKTLTAYGLRLGADIILANSQKTADNVFNTFIAKARSLWSNVNNGFMNTFVDVMRNHKEEFLAEKKKAIDLLSRRAEVFLKEAEKCGLPIYPYVDGFFVTLRIEDQKTLDEYHDRLLDNGIYAIKVNKGIRIGLCGIPDEQVPGLSRKLKELM